MILHHATTLTHPDNTQAIRGKRRRAFDGIHAASCNAGRLRLAKRLAYRLAYLHGIPLFDVTLAPWLCEEPAHTNADALTRWVCAELEALSALPCATDASLHTAAEDSMDALSERLRHRLLSIEDARPW